MRIGSKTATAAVLATGASLIVGCGSEPEYCSARADLRASVEELDQVRLREEGGVDRLKTQLQEVKANAGAVTSSARSDFPEQTQAVERSVKTLEQSVQALPESPAAGDVARLGPEVRGVAEAVQGFVGATDSEC